MKRKIEFFIILALLAMPVCMPMNVYAYELNSNFNQQKDDEIPFLESRVGIELSDDGLFQCYIMRNAFTTAGIEQLLNDGYCLGYIDQIKAQGLIPQDFTPTSSSSEPATANSSTDESAASETTTDSSSTKPQKAEPTLDESVTGEYVVISNDSSVYDSYKAKKEVLKINAGQEVTVTGLMSNGYYRFTNDGSEAYINKKNVTTKEDYDAGWELTDETAATCTEDGLQTYTNSKSGETKSDTVPAFGHDYEVTDKLDPTCAEEGMTIYECKNCKKSREVQEPALGHTEGEWEIAKEPGLFSNGERQIKCTVCGEILKTEEISQKCPIPLWGVIVISCGVIGLAFGGAILLRKKEKYEK